MTREVYEPGLWKGPEGTLMNGYMSLTELGKMFDVSRNQIGKKLKELGYRNDDGRPSQAAYNEGLVAARYGFHMPNCHNWTWHADKTMAILIEAGMKSVLDPAFTAALIRT